MASCYHLRIWRLSGAEPSHQLENLQRRWVVDGHGHPDASLEVPMLHSTPRLSANGSARRRCSSSYNQWVGSRWLSKARRTWRRHSCSLRSVCCSAICDPIAACVAPRATLCAAYLQQCLKCSVQHPFLHWMRWPMCCGPRECSCDQRQEM